MKKGRIILSDSGDANRKQAATDPEQLKEVFKNKLEALNKSAVEKKGEIPDEQLASLERISRLIHLSDDIKPPPKRWPPVLALVLALAVVSILFLVRVPETGITLEVEASELSFVVTAEKPLIGRTAVSQLGVSGLHALHISPDLFQGLTAPDDAEPTSVRLTAMSSNGMSAGAINLATFILPSGSRAWLRYAGSPRNYRLSLKPQHDGIVGLRADAHGELEIAAPGWLDKKKKFEVDKSGATFDFESGKEIMDVDLVLADGASSAFYAQVPIEDLTLLRMEEFAASQKTLVEPVSTVLGGSLYLEALNGEKYDLRAGETINFTSAKGRIESIKLLDDRVAFKFRGSVSGIQIGEEGSARNLMPNLLEWLKARQPLSLVWGALIFVYGLLVAVLNWYRNLP